MLVRLLVMSVCGLYLYGCGTYNQVVYIFPQAADGWIKPGIGVADREFSCNGGRIIVKPAIAYSKRAAVAFFWVPVPGTSEQTAKPSINESLSVRMSIGPNFKLSSCDGGIVTAKGLTKGDIIASRVREETHNLKLGLHFCTYEFVPINELGDEFYLYFSSKVLNCDITPLLFQRKDSTTYVPTAP